MLIKNFSSVKKKFDIVIIGAGPAGISLALELEKKNFSIALIEAGGRDYSLESQNKYKGELEGEFPKKPDVSRLRMLGGTTGHWGGTCRPLDEYDYKSWPLQKKDLNFYLPRATEILKIKNNFRDEAINDNLKLIEFQVSAEKFGELKYFERLEKSKLIHLFLNTPVISIEGKEFTTKKINCFSEIDSNQFSIFGKIFVLATGGIENSRILLLQKLKEEILFNHDIPIGNYWYEHPFTELGKAFINKENLKKKLNTSIDHFVNMFNAGDKSDAYSFSPTHNLIKNKNILNSCCWLVTHDRSNNGWKNIAKNLFCVAPLLSTQYKKLLGKNAACGATIYSSWEQNSEFSNRIVLSDIRDEYGNNQPKIIYKKSETVRDTARTMIEEIGQYLIKNNLGRIAGNSFLYEKNEEYQSVAGWHHMGGTIMGNNTKISVVDKNLKVHGSKNLFVIGSSVFPSGGHANPTLTIIQLSLKLNDHITKNFLSFDS